VEAAGCRQGNASAAPGGPQQGNRLAASLAPAEQPDEPYGVNLAHVAVNQENPFGFDRGQDLVDRHYRRQSDISGGIDLHLLGFGLAMVGR
jgi:hypothetical protein